MRVTKSPNSLGMRLDSFAQNLNFGRGLILAFMIGFFVRLLPEILSFPYPIGYDTMYYAWRISQGVVLFHWTRLFSSWWLFFAFLIPVQRALQVDPFILLKFMAPLLFGLNACGVYYFAMRALNWRIRKSLLAAILFSFQVAALRISWDLYRNALGLGVLLFALPWITSGLKNVKEFVVFTLLSVLVVFSHEFAAVILFVVVVGFLLRGFLKRSRRDWLRVLFASSLAFALFLASVYFSIFPVQSVVQPNVISVDQPLGRYQGPFFFFANYLAVRDSVMHYSTYLDLVSHVLSLCALLYGLVLPFVVVGFFRDSLLDLWTVILFIGSFGALVFPFFALEMWNRWMLMLVFPFTFYVVHGVAKIWAREGQSANPALRWSNWRRLSKRTVKLVLVVSCSMGLIFMCTPLFFGRAGAFGFPMTVSYVPSTMQSNSLPLVDVDGTISVMRWLDVQMDGESVLLVHDAFFWWARLYLDDVHTVVHFFYDIEGAVEAAIGRGFSHIYFVWWNENIGWYSLTVPSGFIIVYGSGRISAFEYYG